MVEEAKTSPQGEQRIPSEWTAHRAIVVLGMHRSGTSALARIVNLLGARLPGKLIEAKSDNEQGFFEPKQLVSLHDRMLSGLDSAWDDFLPLPAGWNNTDIARQVEREVLSFIREDLDESPLIAIKDPRMCRLLPMWQPVFEAAGLEPRFVHVFRNPVEVAASLQRRNGFSPAKSYLIWLRYVLDAERHTRSQPRTFIDFASVVDDPHRAVARICNTAGIDPEGLEESAVEDVCTHLAKGSRHHIASNEQLESDPHCPVWVAQAYDVLKRLESGDANEPDALANMDRIAEQFDQASGGFGPLIRDFEADARYSRRQAKLRSYFLTGEAHEHKRRAAELTRLSVVNRDAVRLVARLSDAALEMLSSGSTSQSGGLKKLSWALAFPWRQTPRFRRSAKLIRRARRFDKAFYLAQVDGLDSLGADPLSHYLVFGWRADLLPEPDFQIPDEAQPSGSCPLVYDILYRSRL